MLCKYANFHMNIIYSKEDITFDHSFIRFPTALQPAVMTVKSQYGRVPHADIRTTTIFNRVSHEWAPWHDYIGTWRRSTNKLITMSARATGHPIDWTIASPVNISHLHVDRSQTRQCPNVSPLRRHWPCLNMAIPSTVARSVACLPKLYLFPFVHNNGYLSSVAAAAFNV